MRACSFWSKLLSSSRPPNCSAISRLRTLQRARLQSHSSDVAQALSAAQHAIEISPRLLEAQFNRALALDALNLRIEAHEAWQLYLTARIAISPWAGGSSAPRSESSSDDSLDEWLAAR